MTAMAYTALVVFVFAAVGLLVGVHLVLALRFRQLARRLTTSLEAAPAASEHPELPEVLRRFAERGGAQGTPRVVQLRQRCEMRLSRGADWQPMTATQTIAVHSPGFVWEARLAKGPLTVVRVLDAYAGGLGRLHVRLFGSLPIGNATGPDTDRGEVMRYLAELPWAPDAILHDPALRWQVLDEHTVEVGVALPGGPATVRFTLDEAGDVVQVDARRPVNETDAEGTTVQRAWRCSMRDYAPVGNRRIPREGEAGYVYDDGYEAYWRGQVIAYEAR